MTVVRIGGTALLRWLGLTACGVSPHNYEAKAAKTLCRYYEECTAAAFNEACTSTAVWLCTVTEGDALRSAVHLALGLGLVAVQWVAIDRADSRAMFGEPAEQLALLGRLAQGWLVVGGLATILAWWGHYLSRGWLVGAAWGVWLLAVLPAAVATAFGGSPDPWMIWIPALLSVGGAMALRGWAWLLVVPVALAAVAWDLPVVTAPPPPGPAAVRVPPVVLVTLDTVRADHLGTLSGPGGPAHTPSLDALAGRGWLFTRGVAPAPLTGPSHAGMLTGEPPHEHRILRNGDPLPADVRSAAEVLREAGWRTGAFLSAAVLDRRTGLDRGFDHYDDRFDTRGRVGSHLPWSSARVLGLAPRPALSRRGLDTVARALRWLEEPSDRPTFLWVHLYDAHAPYTPPEAYRTTSGGASLEDIAAWDTWGNTWLPSGPPFPGLTPDHIRAETMDYAGEVAYVDALVGALVAAAPRDTRWVVAADHGESLIEHGYVLNHGRHVFEVTSRVPIVVVAPDLRPERLDHPVPSWLVGDTLLALAGLPAGPSLLDQRTTPFGDPIVTFAPGQESRRTFGLGGRGAELGWRIGPEKWIVGAPARPGDPVRSWRFDLRTDPDEERPTPTDDPMAASARQLLDSLSSRPDAGSTDWLRALGYAE